MSFLNSIITDLREKRLWPVAVVLLTALVAIPVLLSKSAAKVPVAAVPPASASGSIAALKTALPVVTVSGLPSHSQLKGHGRDPFIQPKLGSSGAPSTTTVGTTTNSTPGSSGSTTSGSTGGTTTTPTGGSGGTGGGTTTTPGGTTTPPIIPSHPANPAPTGLTADQSYQVTVSITNSSGGVNLINPLQRLGLLPSNQRPMLINLGVLKGGKRTLFAVQPGTFFKGPGSCTPGPINCQVLSLGQDQIETLMKQTAGGLVSVAQFAVTKIAAHRFSSSKAATKARDSVSPLGRRLLSRSKSPALFLFPFKSNLGAVVDLRDLKVGGN